LLLAFVFISNCSLFSKNAQKNGFQNYEHFLFYASFFFKIRKKLFSELLTALILSAFLSPLDSAFAFAVCSKNSFSKL